MTDIPWNTLFSAGTGVLTAVAAFYGIQSTNRSKQTEHKLTAAKEEFDRDKQRREAIVADIERCEDRLDELQNLVKKWMGDYDELHAKHLAECTAHGETKVALANCERKIAGLETTLEAITRERDQKAAQIDMLQKMIIDKELKISQ